MGPPAAPIRHLSCGLYSWAFVQRQTADAGLSCRRWTMWVPAFLLADNDINQDKTRNTFFLQLAASQSIPLQPFTFVPFLYITFPPLTGGRIANKRTFFETVRSVSLAGRQKLWWICCCQLLSVFRRYILFTLTIPNRILFEQY